MPYHRDSSTATAPRGSGLLQSDEEWDARNRVLSETLTTLVREWAPSDAERALDVGCQNGATTDRYAELTGVSFQ